MANLSTAQRDWLHQLTGDWQIIADISFSDLVLYVRSGTEMVSAAQARPSTAATVHETDFVGARPQEWFEAKLVQTLDTGEQMYVDDPAGEVDVRLVPVRHDGQVIAVMALVTAKRGDRVPTEMLANYETLSDALLRMVEQGQFPIDGSPSGYRHGTPRVPDGLIHVDPDGVALYASPNAVSHLRRLGVEQSIIGTVLAELVTGNSEGMHQVDEALPLVLMGRAAWMAEVERNDVVVMLRAVPLLNGKEREGAIILCRDISELRRQERELMSKDSTIREINHRVKNNLQTVSALLRMQARRAGSRKTRTALQTAQRRVSTIAVVHEKLSQTIDEVVDFDQVFVPVMRMVRDVAVTSNPVVTTFSGNFGRVAAEQATALGVVMNEIITNSIEHGLPDGGRLDIKAERDGQNLHIEVSDDGVGMKKHKPGLGTQIVQTMVAGELHGTIDWKNRESGGTVVVLDLKIRGA
ncbi:Probable sensor histidine kinase pdtaS [Trueperella bialowiezensis]|uniref:histidine kinase n=1 Tax=Trueperella bialowiezensis TaxID=312285 RepID=A0A3S4X6N6_9ACTO|nr:Probable sensor histidine kinase pdtaS [Trueperella bialowiezensis]